MEDLMKLRESIAITESTLFPSGTGIGAVYSVDAALGSDESQV